MKWYELFKSGNYPQGSVTNRNIDSMVRRFKGETAGVPITIDHNKKGPAYGWVNQLKRSGDKLIASFKDVPEAFSKVVKQGLFKNVSMESRDPDGKGERLRAVTFLGAQTPQIKDLETIEFSEDENVNYTDYNDFKEFKEENMDELEKLKKENAELKNQLESKSKDFSEKESSLKKQVTDLQTSVAEQNQKAKEQEVHLFCEKQQQEGKIGGKEDFAREKQMLMSMDDTKSLEFADTDGKTEKLTQFESYKNAIENRPKLFEEGEVVTDKVKQQYDYSKDNESDPDSAKLFAEAKKLASEKDIRIAEACKIVSTKDGR